jgi:hypothetical protein
MILTFGTAFEFIIFEEALLLFFEISFIVILPGLGVLFIKGESSSRF